MFNLITAGVIAEAFQATTPVKPHHPPPDASLHELHAYAARLHDFGVIQRERHFFASALASRIRAHNRHFNPAAFLEACGVQ